MEALIHHARGPSAALQSAEQDDTAGNAIGSTAACIQAALDAAAAAVSVPAATSDALERLPPQCKVALTCKQDTSPVLNHQQEQHMLGYQVCMRLKL